MKKQRIYIDTSVFGGYFDSEFEEFTKPLFNRIEKGEFIILFSPVTQDELENAPGQIRNLVTNLKSSQTEFLETTSEVVDLATEYIAEKLLAKRAMQIVYISHWLL